MTTITFPAAARRRLFPRGAALGWGVSALVHGLALVCLWRAWPARLPEVDHGPRTELEVRLVPVPVPAPETTPVTTPPAPQALRRPALRPARIVPIVPIVPMAPVAAEAPSVADLPPAPATGTAPADAAGSGAAAPAFDMAAARATARQVARDDKGRKPVIGQDPSNQVQQKLEHARREDCRMINAQSMNLLGSAFVIAKNLVKNAVDESGCKW